MAKAHAVWKVLPHGEIEKLTDRVWRVEGLLAGLGMKRVMTIARRADGDLVVHSAVALGERDMAAIDAWGKVTTVVVPSRFHRLDARIFLDRYPDARVVCPAGARAKVEKVVPVSATYGQVAGDGVVELVALDGTRQREGVMIVRGAGDTTLVLNDAVFNMPHGRGIMGLVLRITGSSGHPRVSADVRWLVVADKQAFRAHLERLAELPDLRRIIVSHHRTIDDDPAGTLRAVAAKL
jgi:hypothetical protein